MPLSNRAVHLCLGPGKIPWKLADVRSLACEMKAGLPLCIAQVLEAPDWQGGSLIQLEDTVSTPRAEDLILNYHFMLPIIKRFRDKVPSQYFLGDTVLYLNKLYFERLLIPKVPGESRVSLAVDEAKKLKLLVGALRTLWRNSALIPLVNLVVVYGNLWGPTLLHWIRVCCHLGCASPRSPPR